MDSREEIKHTTTTMYVLDCKGEGLVKSRITRDEKSNVVSISVVGSIAEADLTGPQKEIMRQLKENGE